MRLFRSVLLLRVVALALVVGVGVSLVPVAAAESGRLVILRGVLEDTRAFEAGLEAARSAESAPLAAFAHAYAAESDDGTTAAAIVQLLGAETLTGVLPPAPHRATSAPEAGTAGASASLGVLTRSSALSLARADASVTVAPGREPARTPSTSAQPRGP